MYPSPPGRLTLLVVILALALAACTPPAQPNPAPYTGLLDSLRTHFAPDHRTAWLDATLVDTSGAWVLRGVSTEPAAKDSLLRALAARGLTVVDSLRMLPDPTLGPDTLGLVRQSVANLRTEPRHGAELTSQAVLGTPLRVLDRQGDWYLVQTPDRYIAWLDSGGLALRNRADMDAWRAAPRLVLHADFGLVYPTAQADTNRPLLDLVPGSILELLAASPSYQHVRTPDGREGYVQGGQPLADWAAAQTYDSVGIMATAERFTGRPYLWGGTSSKGMDCSGFTKTVYFLHGFVIPRDASQQVLAGADVPLDDNLSALWPGDLLFFGNLRPDGSPRITHVGIYLGGGHFIHSGADNGAVRTESLLPDSPLFAPHRRNSLLRARRLRPGSPGVTPLTEGDWYLSSNLR